MARFYLFCDIWLLVPIAWLRRERLDQFAEDVSNRDVSLLNTLRRASFDHKSYVNCIRELASVATRKRNRLMPISRAAATARKHLAELPLSKWPALRHPAAQRTKWTLEQFIKRTNRFPTEVIIDVSVVSAIAAIGGRS